MLLEPTRSSIKRRSRGKTWDTIPGTEKNGFVRIWVEYHGKTHSKRWVKVEDLNYTRNEAVKLWQPLTLVVPVKDHSSDLSSTSQAVAA